jgi:hypothetical protein
MYMHMLELPFIPIREETFWEYFSEPFTVRSSSGWNNMGERKIWARLKGIH